MKKRTDKSKRSAGYFRMEGDDVLRFYSANVLKTSMYQLALVFLIIPGFTIWWGHFTDPEYMDILLGSSYESRELQILYSIVNPIPFLIVALLAPSVRVYFDRSAGVVRYQSGRLAFTLPWSQVTFFHQWFPTRTGGSTLFSLAVVPPFPTNLERIFVKKRKKTLHAPPGQTSAYRLGSFDVRSPEHGQAVYHFLDAWMHSREPADSLYETRVKNCFET